MASGDMTVFDEALAYMIDGGWASADNIKIALITSALAPTSSDTTPILTDYTEVTPGGNYVGVTGAAGETLDTLANCVTEAAGVMTFDDTGASVSWAQHASNPADARYGLILNASQASPQGIAFVDLGAVIDMTAGSLTITWGGSGIFTIT